MLITTTEAVFKNNFMTSLIRIMIISCCCYLIMIQYFLAFTLGSGGHDTINIISGSFVTIKFKVSILKERVVILLLTLMKKYLEKLKDLVVL